jgi:two-component system, CitB family, sensor kinase
MGLQPEDLVALVQNQQAVLGGFGEGVLAVGRDGTVTVCNDEAERLLGVDDPVGARPADLALPREFLRMLHRPDRGPATGTVVVGESVVLVDVRTVLRDGADLGRVAVVRDRTTVEALTRRLDAVGSLTTALRAQRHEFANRLHAISGLLDIGETERARSYLADVQERGPLRYPVQHADRLTEPYLQAFLGAKGVEAAERGVLLRIGPETMVTGTIREPGDVTTVLGNLVDNAVAAARSAAPPAAGTATGSAAEPTAEPWVEVEVLDDGDDLVLSVTDSGPGLPVGAAATLFERNAEDGGDSAGAGTGVFDGADDDGGGADRVHGLGFGLPLSRELARRGGGDVWVGAERGDGHGAVFCARLNGVMT